MKGEAAWRSHFPFLIILAAFVVLATGYSLVTPLYEPTDEVGHFRYIEYLRLFQQLPAPRVNGVLIQSHHPPLFHAAAALASAWVPRDRPWDYEPEYNPFFGYRYWEPGTDNKNLVMHYADETWPYQGAPLAIHVARLFNVLLGALTVWLAYCLAQTIFPQRPARVYGAIAFVAFNPMFLHLSGALNNDIAAGLMGTATLLMCARALRRAEIQLADARPPAADHRYHAGLGIIFGLALLTKFNLLALLPVIEITLVVAAFRQKSWRAFARANLIVLGLALLIAGWWYARNTLLYGEASGVKVMSSEWGGARVPGESITLALSEMPYLWTTLWGRFGYGQLPLSSALYSALYVLVGISLPGLILVWIRGRRRGAELSRTQVLQLGLCAVNLFLFWATIFAYATLSVNAAMGRFLFPALAGGGVLVFLGLCGWVPRRWEKVLAAAINVGLAGLSVYCLFGVLAPAFARPAPLSRQQIASITHPLQAEFGGQARLLGYDINTTQLQPGGELIVTVYWQALSSADPHLTVFVHLLSRDGPLVAQRDTYPGLGKFPASLWRPGDTFSDRYRIVLDPYTYAPDAADVLIGMTSPGEGRLPVIQAERSASTAITLTQVAIAPLEGEYPNPTYVNYDDKIALVGYDLSARSVQVNQPITLTLYWQAIGPMQYEYRVFAHVLESTQKWAAADGYPKTSPWRTWKWPIGQTFRDVRVLRLEAFTPPGLYPIELGWYGGPNEERLPVLAADGHQLDNRVLLTQIRVEPPSR